MSCYLCFMKRSQDFQPKSPVLSKFLILDISFTMCYENTSQEIFSSELTNQTVCKPQIQEKYQRLKLQIKHNQSIIQIFLLWTQGTLFLLRIIRASHLDLSYKYATGENLTMHFVHISKWWVYLQGKCILTRKGHWLRRKMEQDFAKQEKGIFETPLLKGGFEFHASNSPQNKCSIVL